jgi:hypothetical protein
MKRFDVFYKDGHKNQKVVLVQSEFQINILNTLIVAPLVPKHQFINDYIDRLFVSVHFAEEEHVIVIPQIVPLLKTRLQTPAGNLEGYALDITNALDFLFQGF